LAEGLLPPELDLGGSKLLRGKTDNQFPCRRRQIPAVLSFAALEGLDISIVRETTNA
jgi:hypothetical protein